MKRKLAIVYTSIFIGCLPVTAANAVGVFSFTGGVTGSGPLTDQVTIGYGFNVSSNVVVTDIGWFDSNDNGLSADHQIAIWDMSQSQLLSVTIPAGTGTLDDGFRYQPLLITLPLNAGDYVIGGTAASLSDSYVGIATASSNDSSVSYVDPRVNFTGPLMFPTVLNPGDADGYFGPNFKVEPAPVPVPAAVWLLGSGLLGLVGIARKRKAA